MRSLAVLIAFLCLLPYRSASAADEPQWTAGFATADITPQLPTPMAGYYSARLSTETHDPLLAKVTLIDDGQTRAAIVTCDLIRTNRPMVTAVREAIEAKCGIPADHIMISATHSHTGPALAKLEAGSDDFFGQNDSAAVRYMQELPAKLAEATAQAAKKMRPVRVKYGSAMCEGVAFNRRFFMADGTVGWNPGKLNPAIVREAGPVDERIRFVSFYAADSDELLGLHASFALHLDTVGGTAWSADFPYAFREAIKNSVGDGVHVQYMTDTCGDINHIDVRTARPQKGHGEAARIGTRLAAAVLSQWENQRDATAGPLQVRVQTVELEPRAFVEEDLRWAERVTSAADSENPPAFLDQVRAFRIVENARSAGKMIEAEVATVTLGRDVAWVFMPGEIFVQLGTTIKDNSPFATTLVPELAGGSIGYVPTRQAYEQGAYEVVSARCAPGSGERLVDAALKQLTEAFDAVAHSP